VGTAPALTQSGRHGEQGVRDIVTMLGAGTTRFMRSHFGVFYPADTGYFPWLRASPPGRRVSGSSHFRDGSGYQRENPSGKDRDVYRWTVS
jgi:hypothetical protein